MLGPIRAASLVALALLGACPGCASKSAETSPSAVVQQEEGPLPPPVIHRPPTPGPIPCLEYDVVSDQVVYDPAFAPFGAPLVDFAADLNHLYVAANAEADFQAGRVYDVRLVGAHAPEVLANVSPHDVHALAESQDAVLALRSGERASVVSRIEKSREAVNLLEGSEGAMFVAATRKSRFFAYATKDTVFGPGGALFRHAAELNVLALATAGDRAFLLSARDATHGRVLGAGADGAASVVAEVDHPEGRTFASDGERLYLVETGSPSRLTAIAVDGRQTTLADLPKDLGLVRELAFDSTGVYVVGTTDGAGGARVVRVARVAKADEPTSAPPIVKTFAAPLAGRLFAADDCNVYFSTGGKLHRQSKHTLGR